MNTNTQKRGLVDYKLSPIEKMLRLLNRKQRNTGTPMYLGTANEKAVAKRRAKNKVARASRRKNRR